MRFSTAPPEEQRVPWTFVSPRGGHYVVEARYAGDYRWEVEFQPTELGRWLYFYETSFIDEPGFANPYRSAEGFFDVVAGDRETARRGLRALVLFDAGLAQRQLDAHLIRVPLAQPVGCV